MTEGIVKLNFFPLKDSEVSLLVQEVEYFEDRHRLKVVFKNGYTVSIVWGPGTYSDNHGVIFGSVVCPGFKTNPNKVEVGVWDARNEWATHKFDFDGTGDGQVIGWVGREQLYKILTAVARED